jgi:hypothetical protein
MFSTAFLLAASMVVGQAGGAETFNSWANLAVGGSWTRTANGITSKLSFQRALNDRFLKAELDERGSSVSFLIGIDPVTKQCTWWGFDGDGGVAKWIMTRVSEHTWKMEGKGMGPEGEYALKLTTTRIDADTLEETVEHFTVNGKPIKPGTTRWTRTR